MFLVADDDFHCIRSYLGSIFLLQKLIAILIEQILFSDHGCQSKNREGALIRGRAAIRKNIVITNNVVDSAHKTSQGKRSQINYQSSVITKHPSLSTKLSLSSTKHQAS